MAVMSKRIFAQFCDVHQLRPFLDHETLLTVTHTLVTFRMGHCNMLYMGLFSKTSIQKFQLVQNAATWAVMSILRWPPIIPALVASLLAGPIQGDGFTFNALYQ